MTALLARKYATRFLPVSLAFTALLSACSKEETVAPTPVESNQYVLTDVRYSFAAGDHVDTTVVHLKELRVQNPSNTLSTQLVEAGFDELVKTSQFELEQNTSLPKEVDLSQFDLRVPQHWYSKASFDYSVATFPLSTTLHQRPYGFAAAQPMTVQIPAQSALMISRQIEAYHLACSFQAVLENTTTGQRYPLRGKWQGLLQYAHPAITLKQSPL